MTIQELIDNFDRYADVVHAATAAGVGTEYSGQPIIHDTVRDTLTTLSGPQFNRNWGGLEAAAKAAIEGVLNAHNEPIEPAAATAEEGPESQVVKAAPKTAKTKVKK